MTEPTIDPLLLAACNPKTTFHDHGITSWRTLSATEIATNVMAWLVEHDREVLIEWEKRRKADPIIIENIQGEPAAVWLGHMRADAWDEGFAAGHDAGVLDEDRPANPYRESA